MIPPRILCYTIAWIRPSVTHYRQQSHMLAPGLFAYRIHRGSAPNFFTSTAGSGEIGVDCPEDPHGLDGLRLGG